VASPYNFTFIKDPITLQRAVWPGVRFYDVQERIIRSVWENTETVVPAANKVGKDFVAGFIALAYFLLHREVRVLTTSVKGDHLRVLWGEINRFVQSASFNGRPLPLDVEAGGILRLMHQDIRKLTRPFALRQECKISYLLGQVSERGEGLAGHHAEHTLLIIDEASGVDDTVYSQGKTWAKKVLMFGNPHQDHGQNFFYRAVKQGDRVAEAVA
jgi:hypothetical protein